MGLPAFNPPRFLNLFARQQRSVILRLSDEGSRSKVPTPVGKDLNRSPIQSARGSHPALFPILSSLEHDNLLRAQRPSPPPPLTPFPSACYPSSAQPRPR